MCENRYRYIYTLPYSWNTQSLSSIYTLYAPIKALKGFQKLTLKPGETKQAVIGLDSEAFEYYDEMIDELAVKPGRYQILYGTSSLDKDLKALDFVVK